MFLINHLASISDSILTFSDFYLFICSFSIFRDCICTHIKRNFLFNIFMNQSCLFIFISNHVSTARMSLLGVLKKEVLHCVYFAHDEMRVQPPPHPLPPHLESLPQHAFGETCPQSIGQASPTWLVITEACCLPLKRTLCNSECFLKLSPLANETKHAMHKRT